MDYHLLPGTRALIFDLDGTLADTMPFHMKAWKTACREFGFEMTSDYLRSLTGTPAKKIAEEIIDHNDLRRTVSPEQLFQRKIEIFFSLQHQVTEVKPVADIVRRYRGSIPMAIGTGGFREAVDRTLETIGMTGWFDAVVTSNDVVHHKPHPETFLRCAEQMDIDPGSIMVFEDGDLGIEAACRAGMNAIDVRGWYENNW